MVYNGSSKKIVTHCSTVHPRYDTRIFHKMCISLVSHYDVNLIVYDGLGSEVVSGVNIIDIGSSLSRFRRLIFSLFVFPFKVIFIKSDIYHLHDPELIPCGLLLKLLGNKVVYDIHESYSEDILNKYWIPPKLRFLISKSFNLFEKFATFFFDLNVCATSYIASHIRWKAITVNNFPIINKSYFDFNSNFSEDYFVYVGAISIQRGIFEIIDASIRCNVKLVICGSFENGETEKLFFSRIKNNVVYKGQVTNDIAYSLMSKAIAGFLLFHPGPNHDNSLPNKLFEYMAAKIPIICSNFPLWIDIVEKNQCGICVDPFNTIDLDRTILEIFYNKDKRIFFKKNCDLTINNYTWDTEKFRLLTAYYNLIN